MNLDLQTDYVIDTDRGTDNVTTTSQVQEGPTVHAYCSVCEESYSYASMRTYYHLWRVT